MLNKLIHRIRRHKRIRSKLKGTVDVPRVSVFKSNRHIYVQLIDDVNSKTLVSANDVTSKIKGSKTDVSVKLAGTVVELAKKVGIVKVVFDRGGFKYHGRIKALADKMREAGLQF